MKDQKELENTLHYILNSSSKDEFKNILMAYENRVKKTASKKHIDLNKISANRELSRAVNFVLNRSDPEEFEFIKEAIHRRIENRKVVGENKFDKHAGPMIKEIRNKMELSSTALHRTARMMVADLIFQQDPDIPMEDLHILLDEWVPDPNKKNKKIKKMNLPSDVAITMITQFLAYSTGKISKDDLKEFPDDWAKKYWNAFTEDIQELISQLLHNEISEEVFWKDINESL